MCRVRARARVLRFYSHANAGQRQRADGCGTAGTRHQAQGMHTGTPERRHVKVYRLRAISSAHARVLVIACVFKTIQFRRVRVCARVRVSACVVKLKRTQLGDVEITDSEAMRDARRRYKTMQSHAHRSIPRTLRIRKLVSNFIRRHHARFARSHHTRTQRRRFSIAHSCTHTHTAARVQFGKLISTMLRVATSTTATLIERAGRE